MNDRQPRTDGFDVLQSGHAGGWPRQVWQDVLAPSLRRHRGRWLIALGLLLAGLSGAVVLFTRPPPVDPVVRIDVTSLPVAGPTDFGHLYAPVREGPETAADYDVKARDHGDTVRVLGFEGPGLVATSASRGTGSTVTLRAQFECSTSAWQFANDRAYRMRVVRIDRYGRELHAIVALPAAEARAWRQAVQSSCLNQALSRGLHPDAVKVSTTSTVAAEVVSLDVRLHNPLDIPIYVQLAFPAEPGPARLEKMFAGSPAWLHTDWPLWRCSEYRYDLLAGDDLQLRAGVERLNAPDPFTPVDVTDPYLLAVDLPDQLARSLRGQLRTACQLNRR